MCSKASIKTPKRFETFIGVYFLWNKYFSKQSHILGLKFTELENLQNTGKLKIKIGGVF